MAVTTDIRFDGSQYKIAIVVGRFNSSITKKLLDHSKSFLLDKGFPEANLDVFWVPGAFEIPQAAKFLAKTKRYHAILPLGCVIRGETPHFDYVCEAAVSGLSQLALELDIPIVLGLLTTENMDQAIARSGEQSDKGSEAARALLEMLKFKAQISQPSSAQE